MIAKIHYIGKVKKYKVIIKNGEKVVIETFTRTFTQAVKIIENYKGGKLCVR